MVTRAMRMRGGLAGLLGPLVVLAIAALAGREALRYGLWAAGNPGSGLLPLIACALLALLALLDLSRWLKQRAAGAIRSEDQTRDDLQRHSDAGAETGSGPVLWWRVAAYAAALVGFALGMQYLGFVPAALASLALAVRFGEGRDWGRSVAVATVTVGFSWLLFARLLSVPLPAGSWLGLL